MPATPPPAPPPGVPGAHRACTIVFFDPERASVRLVRAGLDVAGRLNTSCIVVYRELTRVQLLSDAARARIQSVLQFAEECGAEVITVSGAGGVGRIAQIAKERQVACAVFERPHGALLERWHGEAMVRAVRRAHPDADILLVAAAPADPAAHAMAEGWTEKWLPEGHGARSIPWQALAWAVLLPLAITVVAFLAFDRADTSTHLILYLLGVAYVASRFGFLSAAGSALLSLLVSDFFFIRPLFSFTVARTQDTLTLAVFLVAALGASSLTAELRFQEERSRQREQRLRFLYGFTRAIAGASTVEEVARIAAEHIDRELRWRCRIYLADSDGRLQADGAAIKGVPDFDVQAARREFSDERSQGRQGSLGAPGGGDLFLTIAAASRRYGVLALHPVRLGVDRLSDELRIAGTLAGQIAQAMERARLGREAMAAAAKAETESLRNALLSGIAHDFRTPLASIVAASETLTLDEKRLSPSQARELAQTILEEGERMTRLANNTLEMARLESGAAALRRDWYPLDEIVGAAVSRMQSKLRRHALTARTGPDLALAFVDEVAIVQVLENLLDNAVKYSPPGTPIDVGATSGTQCAEFWVADRGRGIRPEDAGRIFEKFYRGQEQGAQSGFGLGLTLCDHLVRAHGGRISLGAREGGGTEFRVAIPHGNQAPPRPPE